jgi:programmed cell death 6-interacting protein
VLQRSRAATKDNDNVYFQALPAAAALPIVESKILVKVTPFEDAPIGADPFSYLIPAAVAEAAAACRQKLHDLINVRAQSAGEATAAVKQALASMELPSCIDAVDSSPQNSVPVELSRALAAARAKGGLTHLNERWRSLQDLSTHVNGVVGEVRATLSRESSEDQTYRDRFGQRWSRSRSDDITVGFIKDLSTVEQYLAQAASANQTIENELRTNESYLRLLAMDVAAVEARIPRATAAAKLPEVAAVRNTLFELSDLVERREALIGMLQASVGEFSFLPICSQLESAGKNADHIFKDFLATPHVAPMMAPFSAAQIAAMLSELNQSSETSQPPLLAALRERHAAFVAAQRNGESASGAARLAALKDFQQAADSFNRILSFLDQGVKFHTDVLVQYLTPLSQHVSDFAMARNMEASANLQDLSTKIAAMSVTSQGAVQGYGSLPATQPTTQPSQGAFIYPSAPNGLI